VIDLRYLAEYSEDAAIVEQYIWIHSQSLKTINKTIRHITKNYLEIEVQLIDVISVGLP